MAITKPSIFFAWAETGSITDPGVPKTQLGWLSEVPTFQNFNWILNRQDVFNQHINERGIAEHDLTTSYIINSLVTGSDGYVYKSLIDPNLGNDPVGDGGVNQPNVNWVLESVDNRWFDHGDVPEFRSSAGIEFTGVDLSARYPLGTRVKISGTATGIIYADINSSIFVLGDTRIALTIDNADLITNEVLDFIKVSTFEESDSNLPFGLGGLNDVDSSSSLQSVLRRVRIQGTPVSGVTQLVMTAPDTNIKDMLTTSVGDNGLFLDNGFIKIGANGIGNRIRFTNIAGKTLNLRTSINKGAWVINNVADTAVIDKDIGANGVIEVQVSNKDTADPRALSSVIESDASNNAFAQNIITKNHFV